MATEVLRDNGRKTNVFTYFKAVTGPVFVPPPAGQSGPGYWIPGSGYYVTEVTDVPFELEKQIRTSLKTPGFNSPSRPYLLKPLAFSYSKTRTWGNADWHIYSVPTGAANGPGSASYEDRKVSNTNTIVWGFASDPTSTWESQLRSKATANLLKNLRGSSFNAAQAFAERNQTANLVASTATKVAKSLSSLKRGNFAKAARDLGLTPKKRATRRFNSEYIVDQGKAVGNGWLELQYGWKPLLSDVYGAMETLAKSNNQGNPNTIFKKSSGRAKRKEAKGVDTNQLPVGATGYSMLTRYYEAECLVRTGVTYKLSSPPLSSLASVGITNPLLLGWELLPYSFVVDWFFPIGNYLESLDATSGLTFDSGYISVLRKFKAHTYKVDSFSRSSGYTVTTGMYDEATERVTATRELLGSFPSMPFPTFKNPLSTSHVASAMALLLQLKR